MDMSRNKILEASNYEFFICEHCGNTVAPAESGTNNRNHCPVCLRSRHLDIRPGDRRSGCRGSMEPIGIWIRNGGEWALIHRCVKCGVVKTNRIAGDDDEVALFALAARPLTKMPFPSDSLFEKMTVGVQK